MPQIPPRILDIHVHLAGVSAGGNGCVFAGSNRLSFRLIRRNLRISKQQSGNSLEGELLRSLNSYVAEPTLQAVVLAMDWARDRDGEPLPQLTDFFVPNDFVLQVADSSPSLHAGVSIHPFRSDALSELHRCRAAGASLVKWLPVSQNFSPADPRCRPFYKELATLGIPLLCHTGSEGATRNIDKSWNNPQVLEQALDLGVTVIAAHCGMRSLPHDRDYFDKWTAMLKHYPDLYGDIASVFGLRARGLIRALGRDLVVERMIHGSDWPVPASPWWFLGKLSLGEIQSLAKLDNPLLRDAATKYALGIPAGVFFDNAVKAGICP